MALLTLSRDGRLQRTDIWREGKWLDLWSVVHVLSGVSMGLTAALLPFGTAASVVIAFLLLVAYEMWEAMVKIEETPQNRVMDVVVGMASFVPTLILLAPHLSGTVFILTFGLILTVNIVMSVFGWLASRKAAALEHRLRFEIEEQKRKFEVRRARARERRQLRKLGRRQ